MMRHFRTTLLLALMAGALPTVAVSAQDNIPWRLSYFPYLTASPNDGVMGIARAIWFQQAGWGERVTLDKYVAVEAGYSTRDAWKASLTYGAPRLTDDWRLMAHAEIGHEPNFGDPDLPEGLSVVRDRAVAWIDVTRRVHGPLHLAVRPAVRRTALEFGVGDIHFAPKETDVSLRAALVLDTRDREFEENSGVLIEAGAIGGSGGTGSGGSYTAPYAHARGWVHPYLPLRLTGRVAWRGTTGSGALAPAFEFPGWEDDFTMLGGHQSHRGLPVGAVGVDGVVMTGAEARFDVINIGEIGAVTLIGFVDGARLLFGERDDELSLTGGVPIAGHGRTVEAGLDEWTVAAGGGIALRVLRAATLTITAARANHDTRWYVGSGWSW